MPLFSDSIDGDCASRTHKNDLKPVVGLLGVSDRELRVGESGIILVNGRI